MQQNRLQEAIDEWRPALRATGHWIFLLRLADAYASQGRFELALAYYLRTSEEASSAFMVQFGGELRESIQSVEQNLPSRIDVDSDVQGATILVDDEPSGSTPMAQPIEIEPGRHSIRLELDGRQRAAREVETYGARTTSVMIPIIPREERNNPPQDQPQDLRRHSMSRLWSLLFFGSATALGAVGGWLLSIDGQINEDTRQMYDTLGPGVLVASLGLGLVTNGILLLVMPP